MNSIKINNKDRSQEQYEPLGSTKGSRIECVTMQNTSTSMQRKLNRWIYAIEKRRREVAQMLAQGHTETERAQLLHVHVSTISRDVKVLKQLSQRFVFDLAKGDLVHYYKQCIDEIEEVRREAWRLHKYGRFTEGIMLSTQEQIMALRLAKECSEAKFVLLEKGPTVLNLKSYEEKLDNIQNKSVELKY